MTANKTNKRPDVKKITMLAMLTAVAVVLQYVEISIPLMPGFIKLDFSDLPELIAAFVCGPVSGVAVALLKNIIHLVASQSGFAGELSNFLLGAVFAFTAGMIYRKKSTPAGAAAGAVVGSVIMGIVSLPFNYFIIYPLYYNVMGFPEAAILEMYQLLRPSTESIAEALWVFNVPFTIIKGLICSVMAAAVYRPLAKIINRGI